MNFTLLQLSCDLFRPDPLQRLHSFHNLQPIMQSAENENSKLLYYCAHSFQYLFIAVVHIFLGERKVFQFYFQLIFRCDFLDCIVLGFPGRSNVDSSLLIIMVKNSSTLVVLFALLPHPGFCNCISLVLLHIHFSAIHSCSVLIAQLLNAKCFFKRQRRWPLIRSLAVGLDCVFVQGMCILLAVIKTRSSRRICIVMLLFLM